MDMGRIGVYITEQASLVSVDGSSYNNIEIIFSGQEDIDVLKTTEGFDAAIKEFWDDCEYFMLLDQAYVLKPKCIERMVECFKEDDYLGIVYSDGMFGPVRIYNEPYDSQKINEERPMIQDVLMISRQALTTTGCLDISEILKHYYAKHIPEILWQL